VWHDSINVIFTNFIIAINLGVLYYRMGLPNEGTHALEKLTTKQRPTAKSKIRGGKK
jgi:hypothetical protein